jgi:hypothetical protein
MLGALDDVAGRHNELPLLFGVSRDRGHVRTWCVIALGLAQKTRCAMSL